MKIQPPIAPKHPTVLKKHGDLRVDDYYWMNDRNNAAVIDYLKAENAYYETMTAPTGKFREALFLEMKSRIKEDDTSVPYKLDGYWYLTRYETGREYPLYLRKKETLKAPEELLFNCNTLARGHAYFKIKGIAISPNNTLASFGTDTVSRRQYTLQIKNLTTGEIYATRIENTTGSAVWANDNKTLFYVKKDPVTLRPNKVYKHVLGTSPANDQLVFHETDATFATCVYKTKSKKYIVIGSASTLTSEYQILEADNPGGKFKLFARREKGVEYTLAHYNSHFYVLTNKDKAVNFKLMKTSENKTASRYWEEYIPHRKEVLLEDIELFKNFYVLSERTNGLNQLKIVRWDGSDSYYLPFTSETYIAGASVNLDFDTDEFRYYYNDMSAPYRVIDFNMEKKTQKVLKEQEVLGGKFHKDNYCTERLWAPARDGAKVPVSLIYHKDTKLNGTSPLLQYAYGSYGHTIDPCFSSLRLSLLDRGFIFAIAHVRGGEYLGRPWYEDGKLLRKHNTFTDFMDCSQFLIEKKYTSSSHLYASGGSAGGLLMGVILNSAPELYNGVIATVPFVDVVTTMLDDTLPLTTGEYDEWGNPNEKQYYTYLKSYSPYDNVKAQNYPHLYVSTGLYDSQVQYWEPAKWVAKLRAYKTNHNLLFLDTNLEAGHGGASGRFQSLKETVKEYTFILALEGKVF